MLTDKTKEDFIVWLNIQEIAPYAVMFDDLPKSVKKAYIINWLDSLQHEGERYFLQVFEKSFAIKTNFMGFDDITDQAIEICNNHYNKIKKE